MSPRYPQTVQDVHIVIQYLRQAFREKLPDELLKQILYRAGYDCLHFTARSRQLKTAYATRSDTKISPPIAYVETEPLSGLSPSSSVGRVRSLHLHVVGRDQGWVSDSTSTSWSWFEVRRRRIEQNEWEGFTWARNSVAGENWQHHYLDWHADDESERNEVLGKWIQSLEDGNQISIVPMAQFEMWECRMNEGSIDVEIEVWR